jgi:hypothetical protein
MQTFKVNLTRVYSITIDAENKKSAKQLAEFFIGDPEDKSNAKDRKDHNFSIQQIEMLMNEAFETE